ncbi:MAG TPA: hypothetical protein VFQ96_05530, partial [Microbacteriaceae bacterium]|nr:hypothetical protein [Microbacteriaceae bacterium]
PTLPYAAAADAAGQTKARRGTQGGANGTKRAESVEDRAGGAAAGRGPAPERDPKDVLAEAADPATPASRLHELAGAAPYARAALAGNPSTYPALVEWLGRLGDPEVNAALARRAASPADDATTPGGDESA